MARNSDHFTTEGTRFCGGVCHLLTSYCCPPSGSFKSLIVTTFYTIVYSLATTVRNHKVLYHNLYMPHQYYTTQIAGTDFV